MEGSSSILFPEDCGLINGYFTLNGWFTDVAMIRGIYAPPYFSSDFLLSVYFGGKRVHADSYRWAPDVLIRRGAACGCKIESRLVPLAEKQAAILAFDITNTCGKAVQIPLQVEMRGTLNESSQWGFSKPVPEKNGLDYCAFEDDCFYFSKTNIKASVSLTWSAISLSKPLASKNNMLAPASDLTVLPNKKLSFYLLISVGEIEGLRDVFKQMPERLIEEAREHWNRRVKALYSVMPNISCSDKAFENLYDRSLLHLLLNEWRLDVFVIKPYYATGGINGGCIGCYLWNYGEPYRLWSMLNPTSARQHLKIFLKLDLANCYAFNPTDGAPFGPYYPVNQEKIILLTHAYVMQTGDVEFLNAQFNGRRIIDYIVEQALMHDELDKDAVLVDYGNGNHHLELRKEFRYDGIMPDLNLRRCVNFHLADKLCRLADVKPPVDLLKRAENLRNLIRKELFDKKIGWYSFILSDGKKDFRYTMQVFKALGWEDWAMGEEEETALIKHLMNKSEFRGDYGLHSLSKLDEAYDVNDIDNGGPGSCISFTPAVIDRLYQGGRIKEAETLLRSLTWLAEDLPYWGDSQRADVREYRRDTPLQNDIQGAAIAQTFIFGVFGIKVNDDFTVTIAPHLPENVECMRLDNVRLAGHVFSIECCRGSAPVVTDGNQIYSGEKITLPNLL